MNMKQVLNRIELALSELRGQVPRSSHKLFWPEQPRLTFGVYSLCVAKIVDQSLYGERRVKAQRE
jgi:hypothetical protein